MTDGFISNSQLNDLLSKATEEERLALTKILDSNKSKALSGSKLQEEICLFGGHGVANLFRGSGTGYLDIIDDVAEALDISDRASYQSVVKYFDEIFYIKGEKNDKPDSSIKCKYHKGEATKLGLEYASKMETKIIVKVMENAYKAMENEVSSNKASLRKTKSELELLENRLLNKYSQEEALESDISVNDSRLKKFGYGSDNHAETILEVTAIMIRKRNADDSNPADKPDDTNEELDSLCCEYSKLRREMSDLKKEAKRIEQQIEEKNSEIVASESTLNESKKRLEEFDSHLSQTINSYDKSHAGAITGTAGLMVLANLGGFATYTFLTSMMSVVSFGTLGFGAYTAATSFLSVVIGPVGWASLGLWAIFRIGKPDMNKLVLIVATIGTIRQRVTYASQNTGYLPPPSV